MSSKTVDFKYNFIPRLRSYSTEKRQLPCMITFNHPLSKGIEPSVQRSRRDSIDSVASKASSTKSKLEPSNKDNTKAKKDFIDPLGAFVDPLSEVCGARDDSSVRGTADVLVSASLSQRLLGIDVTNKSLDKAASGQTLTNTLQEDENCLTENSRETLLHLQCPSLDGFVPWNQTKKAILNKFGQNDKFNLLSPACKSSLVDDTTKLRLELTNKGLQKTDLTQLEYTQQVNEAEVDLKQAWKEDKRVEALRIVMHMAALLGDTSATNFYPTQFVLVTDLLDYFGSLVFERLWTKANYENRKLGKAELGEYFDGDDVPELAKEIGRNWNYKIGSIRELLPRFYAETSFVKCLRFLYPNAGPIYAKELNRLARSIRGIADPLVASYAYSYLCRVAIQVNAQCKDHIWTCLHSWMFTWKNSLTWHEFNNEKNVGIVQPAMSFVLECLAYNCTEEDLLPIWEWVKQSDKQTLLLTPVFDTFPPKYISWNSVELAKILLSESATKPNYFVCEWLSKFGKALLRHEPAPEVKRPLVREVWKRLKKLENIDDYLKCAQVWMKFACIHLGSRDINSLIEDVILHVKPDKVYCGHLSSLVSLLRVMVESVADLSVLFSLDQFIQLLDLLQNDTVALKAARCILEAFCANQGRNFGGGMESGAFSNHIVQLCRTIHDSLNALSLEDERRSSVSLICKSLDAILDAQNYEDNCDISKTAFLENVEKELDFLVECRAAFSNLDEIVEYLVRRVHRIPPKLRNYFKDSICQNMIHASYEVDNNKNLHIDVHVNNSCAIEIVLLKKKGNLKTSGVRFDQAEWSAFKRYLHSFIGHVEGQKPGFWHFETYYKDQRISSWTARLIENDKYYYCIRVMKNGSDFVDLYPEALRKLADINFQSNIEYYSKALHSPQPSSCTL